MAILFQRMEQKRNQRLGEMTYGEKESPILVEKPFLPKLVRAVNLSSAMFVFLTWRDHLPPVRCLQWCLPGPSSACSMHPCAPGAEGLVRTCYGFLSVFQRF